MSKPSVEPVALPLRPVLASLRSAFIAVAWFSLGVNLLMLAVPLYMMQLFDRVLATRNVDTLLALTAIAVVSILVLGALDVARSALMVRCGTSLDRWLSAEVLDCSARRGRRDGSGPGAQGLRDLAAIRGYLGGPAVMAIFDAPFVPVFIAVVFFIHPTLGWIATAGALALFLLAFLNEYATRDAIQEANRQSAVALNRADAALRNSDAIEALGMMDALKMRWGESNDQFLDHYQTAGDYANAISAAARVLRLGLQVAMLGTGAWLAMSDLLTGGAMIAASIIAARALAPLEQSINGWKLLIGAQEAYRRVRELLQAESRQENGIALPPPQGHLAVQGLIYIPLGASEPVLRDISFVMAPGMSLGVIGASAAGKTTLLRHLVGSLVPTRGHVRLDGAELSLWDASDRGQWIGYLPQDVELFAGTVRENISRLKPAPDEAVIEAAKIAGAHETILSLPRGYDTPVQPVGGALSGGQRQRIALARAVFGRPRLVVLDEPNANLDGEGEQALIKALADLKALGTTVVMVAHRPSVMASMDRLLMLRNGSIAALGDREEMLGKLAVPFGSSRSQRTAPTQTEAL